MVTPRIVAECMGSEFSDFFFLPALGTHGGVILAWKVNHVDLSNPHITEHVITVRVNSASGF